MLYTFNFENSSQKHKDTVMSAYKEPTYKGFLVKKELIYIPQSSIVQYMF